MASEPAASKPTGKVAVSSAIAATAGGGCRRRRGGRGRPAWPGGWPTAP